jgi:uncharacterized damage-inducible protein DinB
VSNREFFLQTLTSEVDKFNNVMAACPEGKLGYRPAEKSRSTEELLGHLVGHWQDLIELLDAGVINHRMQVPITGVAHAVSLSDAGLKGVLERLAKVDDARWATLAEFKVGDRVIAKAPIQALAWMLFLDGVHHRGQLSTYIRPMGGKVPGIYGPSADTPMGG